MKNEIKEIHFDSGPFMLSAFIHIPEGKNPPFVIGSHGLLSDAMSAKQINLANELNKRNIGYMRINHRGSGKSEGDLENSNLETRKEDLVSAFNYLKKNFNPSKTGLFGSSMGGASCIYANEIINPNALVLTASPLSGHSMGKAFSLNIKSLIKESGLSENFFKKNMDFDITEKTFNLKNVLVIHGDKDEIVPFENGEKLFSNSMSPKKFLRIENANHRIENINHQEIFQKNALDWFIKYLEYEK